MSVENQRHHYYIEYLNLQNVDEKITHDDNALYVYRNHTVVGKLPSIVYTSNNNNIIIRDYEKGQSVVISWDFNKLLFLHKSDDYFSHLLFQKSNCTDLINYDCRYTKFKIYLPDIVNGYKFQEKQYKNRTVFELYRFNDGLAFKDRLNNEYYLNKNSLVEKYKNSLIMTNTIYTNTKTLQIPDIQIFTINCNNTYLIYDRNNVCYNLNRNYIYFENDCLNDMRFCSIHDNVEEETYSISSTDVIRPFKGAGFHFKFKNNTLNFPNTSCNIHKISHLKMLIIIFTYITLINYS